jgi:Lrp/AsnC family transcriptional regulator, leucine-responsive regulatory protein
MKLGNESPLDELDWKIIVALQEDARLSMGALGRRIGLSPPPATTERVRRLEERKIVRAYRAEIGLDRLGLPVEAIVRIDAPGHGLDKATRALCAFPEVLECPNTCFKANVAAKSPEVGFRGSDSRLLLDDGLTASQLL